MGNLSKLVAEATIGDHSEKFKNFDIDRFNSGKSAFPTLGDHIKENPKIAAAAGAVSALGAGYGAYKYLKNRKNKKK